MRVEKESAKVKQTKKVLKDAFIELHRHKPIEKISIKEITELTGVNRGTFYIHFNDIYDLLEQIENEFLTDSEEIIKRFLTLGEHTFEENFRNPTNGFLEVLRYIRSREKYIPVLFGNAAFKKSFKSHIKQLLYNHLKSLGLRDLVLDDFQLEYISSADMGIILYWVDTGMKISEEELVQRISDFLFKGPLSAVAKK